MGSNQYWAGRVYDLCVYFMTGTPEGSTESGFIDKPGILRVKHFVRTQTCSPTFFHVYIIRLNMIGLLTFCWIELG